MNRPPRARAPRSGLRLAVDAGNTRIKWGLANGADFNVVGALPTAHAETLVEAWRDLPLAGARVVVCNVAGEAAAEAIAGAVAGVQAHGVWFASVEQRAGVSNGYDRPGQLGADRFAALIGARARCDTACIVVNAGTAVTIDALDAHGRFLGGMILPGFVTMHDALERRTAGLAARTGRYQPFPRNTADAMTTGAIDAITGAAARFARRLAEVDGAGEVPWFVSGGSAPVLQPGLPPQARVVEHLVLEGLLVADAAETGA